MPTLGELVSNIIIAADDVKNAKEARQIADDRLIDALALMGNPLEPTKGRVVIGNILISRPYPTLELEFKPVVNLPDGAVPNTPPAPLTDLSEMF